MDPQGFVKVDFFASETGDFGEALNSFVAAVDWQNKVLDQSINHVGVEDEFYWDPAEILLKSS